MPSPELVLKFIRLFKILIFVCTTKSKLLNKASIAFIILETHALLLCQKKGKPLRNFVCQNRKEEERKFDFYLTAAGNTNIFEFFFFRF